MATVRNINRLQGIGFWRQAGLARTWPHPKEFIVEWDDSLKQQIVHYLQSGVTVDAWLIMYPCAFPGGPPPHKMGTRALTDGTWVWPESLIIYVRDYNVGLPEWFIEHTRKQNFTIDQTIDVEPFRRIGYSLEEWIRWCNQTRRNRLLAFLNRLFFRKRNW
jgi:hypothetical protein